MEMTVKDNRRKLGFIIFLCFISVVLGATDSNDLKILFEFRDGLDNPELLNWPSKGDNPCGPPKWDHVFCNGDRVSQIQVQNLGLKGPLPQSFNKLTQLENLGLQRNNFNGKLPTFSGLSELKYAYLGNNQFDTIPSDFFNGLNNLLVVSLENNPLNATSGWSIPTELQNSPQLTNLSLSGCNLVGPLPDFLGHMSSLTALKLSYNRLSGEIPATFNESQLQILWLNNQDGSKMSGSIDVIASMVSLTQVWLHGNHFTGTIPANIGDLASLRDLNLNQNDLVGLIPESLANLELENLNLNNNKLMGPIPKFKSGNITYSGNSFCQSAPGISCSLEVTALLDFLGNLRYPSNLASSWSGNSPCEGPWAGLNCNPTQKVSVINLPRFKLNGTLSPSIGKLNSLIEIRLGGNHLTGSIPSNFTELQSLRLLDLSGNNLDPPLPKFRATVQLITDGNPKLSKNQTVVPPPPPPPPPKDNSTRETPPPPLETPSPPSESKPSPPPSESKRSPPDTSGEEQFHSKSSKNFKFVTIVAPLVGFMVFVFLVVPLSICYCKKRKRNPQSQTSFVVHPRDAADPENMVKIAVSNNNNSTLSTLTGCSSESRNSSGTGESHVIESGNLIISVQVLRNVTKNFAPENQLGRGGFGTVYKGELDDGTKIAVKRMEAGVITNTALHEFQAEIMVLSKVRHRHLVSLLGYSIEGGEKLLVYEYMPQGALSRHLFHRESSKIEPLSWKRRLNIALDVARGLEYLHNLAHQSFIHRDLKSANILLGDDYRAKISDFGLVKLAPDGQNSVVTRLAGTFGYLAPEYAVTGKITTKADVFSFGVVLMELLTGLMALDESRPEESRYLAAWFWRIKSSEEKLKAAIDPVLDLNEETFESISIIAELAGHCTAREPNQRPDMGHVVNVLSPLVEKWKPFDDEAEEYSGIDYNLPLTQMVKGWQEAEGKDESYSGLEDSKGSIPARPTGFAESFTSTDGR